MTIGELLDILDGMDEGAEVLFMAQPNYPFVYAIDGASSVGYMVEQGQVMPDELNSYGGVQNGLVLFEGYQKGYGSKDAFDFPEIEG